MGLDISAYGKVSFVKAWPKDTESMDDIATYDGNGYKIDGVAGYVTEIHPATDRSFPEHRGDMKAGIYTYGERMGFRAGSYSGYSEWRSWFAIGMLGMSAESVWRAWNARPEIRERGAAWLVNFSDCEGYIGGDVCRRILADIRAHEADLRSSAPDSWYIEKLDQWIAGLEMAADGGMLEFH